MQHLRQLTMITRVNALQLERPYKCGKQRGQDSSLTMFSKFKMANKSHLANPLPKMAPEILLPISTTIKQIMVNS